MSWQQEAACLGRTDIVWFPTMTRRGGTSRAWRDNINRARQVCAGCTVRADCMDDALDHWGTAGIWAGTTQHERDGLTRVHVRPVAVCGTDSGYYRHLRQTATPPCDACRAAHAVANRRRDIA